MTLPRYVQNPYKFRVFEQSIVHVPSTIEHRTVPTKNVRTLTFEAGSCHREIRIMKNTFEVLSCSCY